MSLKKMHMSITDNDLQVDTMLHKSTSLKLEFKNKSLIVIIIIHRQC